MRSKILFLCLYFSIFIGRADAKHYTWATYGGGNGYDCAYDIVVDGQGYRYIVGCFSDTVKFEGHTMIAKGSGDFFLAKYDPFGNLVWLQRQGGNGRELAYKIKIDIFSNIYVVGYFIDSTLVLGKGKNIIRITNRGSTDGFIAKYDSSGSINWVRTIATPYGDQFADFSLDHSGHINITGIFNIVGNYDTLVLDKFILPSYGKQNCLIGKLDTSGKWISAWSTEKIGLLGNVDIDVDQWKNTYISGSYADSITLGKKKYISYKSNNFFIAKIDSTGKYIWSKVYQSDGYFGGYIRLNPLGTPYLIMGIYDSVKIGSKTYRSAGGSDILHIKMDTAGNFIWINQYGGKNGDYLYKIVFDPSGNSYLCGAYGDGIRFNTTTAFHSAGRLDLFVAAFDSAGKNLWVKTAGGAADDWATGMCLDKYGNIFLSGTYSTPFMVGVPLKDSIKFDNNYAFPAFGNGDAYMAELSNCISKTPNLTPSSKVFCTNNSNILSTMPVAGYQYQWSMNGKFNLNSNSNKYNVMRTGIYSLVEYDTMGCLDSSRDTFLRIIKPFSVSLHKGRTVFCQGDSSRLAISIYPNTYDSIRWYNNFLKIPGAKDSSCYIKSSGTYYAIVSDSGCNDTSASQYCKEVIPSKPVIVDSGGRLYCKDSGASYQWYKNGKLISGATSRIYIPAATDSYTVEVTNSLGCNATSGSIYFTFTGIQSSNNSLADIRIYPNPCHGSLHIQIAETISAHAEIIITDLQGRTIYRATAPQNGAESVLDINMGSAAIGMYIYRLRFPDGVREGKIIIE